MNSKSQNTLLNLFLLLGSYLLGLIGFVAITWFVFKEPDDVDFLSIFIVSVVWTIVWCFFVPAFRRFGIPMREIDHAAVDEEKYFSTNEAIGTFFLRAYAFVCLFVGLGGWRLIAVPKDSPSEIVMATIDMKESVIKVGLLLSSGLALIWASTIRNRATIRANDARKEVGKPGKVAVEEGIVTLK